MARKVRNEAQVCDTIRQLMKALESPDCTTHQAHNLSAYISGILYTLGYDPGNNSADTNIMEAAN